MYERMLDKQRRPTEEEFFTYCGLSEKRLVRLNQFLLENLKNERLLRFPYGNRYGWGMKYFIKSKHVCDVFAEKDAFTVLLRLSSKQLEKEYVHVTDETKSRIDQKYPCGDGGWVSLRVLSDEQLDDAQKLLALKG